VSKWIHRRRLGMLAAATLSLPAIFAALNASVTEAASAAGLKRAIVSVTPVRPYAPGDQVWASRAPLAGTLATGCQRVPSTGYLGTNAYAQTTAEYANRWDWSSGSSFQSFAWWIKKTDGTTQASGTSAGAGSGITVAANIYYWRIQNRGGAPQAWNVCFDVI
jgi:hypothetical protein